VAPCSSATLLCLPSLLMMLLEALQVMCLVLPTASWQRVLPPEACAAQPAAVGLQSLRLPLLPAVQQQQALLLLDCAKLLAAGCRKRSAEQAVLLCGHAALPAMHCRC
jgi:hypothetical protein